EAGQTVDVDDGPRCGQPHVESGHEALAAGKDAGVVAVPVEQVEGLGETARTVVVERSGLHPRALDRRGITPSLSSFILSGRLREVMLATRSSRQPCSETPPRLRPRSSSPPLPGGGLSITSDATRAARCAG